VYAVYEVGILCVVPVPTSVPLLRSSAWTFIVPDVLYSRAV
jgi:hypothetical protein